VRVQWCLCSRIRKNITLVMKLADDKMNRTNSVLCSELLFMLWGVGISLHRAYISLILDRFGD
jgi:hypothetical protein